MRVEELDYPLPPQRIATAPAEPRDSARLLVAHRDGRLEHARVRDLPALGVLRPGDLMVFNVTKVLPASFRATREATGGRVSGLYLPPTRAAADARLWRVVLQAGGALRTGERLALEGDSQLELLERLGEGLWAARLHGLLDTLALLQRVGATPLPPYIRQQRKARHQPEVTSEDALRYNTVYARDAGSVAAPTAGLHFTPELLAALDRLGVGRASLTLHVGRGTFAPIRTRRVEDHPIHREWISVPGGTLRALRETRRRGGRIVPVGTTTVRALESLPADWEHLQEQDYVTDTGLLIAPGFAFRFTDALMTNFHLPRSSLLALVAALPQVGVERLKGWYHAAVDAGYRFYSYGDAMLIV